jgi:hypothetical protein
MQIGCPIVPGHNYYCTSSGICAETIFIEKQCTIDADCPTGTECDITSGLCIEKVIFEKVIQCNSNSECIIPCPGITANCIDNKCSYQGSCIPTIADCNTLGCPSGFSCYKEGGVCIRTEIIKEITQCESNNDCASPCPGITANCIDKLCNYQGACNPVELGCTQTGCPEGYNCDKRLNVCKREIVKKVKVEVEKYKWLLWVLIGVVAILFIILIIVLIKFLRRK